ncbi:MAG: hypothetical protein IPN19_01145 [Elusimicrobia bacterium]|nr:hypothetical protein [Elusimicrobiota bacterium]
MTSVTSTDVTVAVPASRSVITRPTIQTAPNRGSFSPSNSTDTAARAVTRLSVTVSSCGWYMVVTPAFPVNFSGQTGSETSPAP